MSGYVFQPSYKKSNIIRQIDRIPDTENVFALAYPQLLTGSEIYQTKT